MKAVIAFFLLLINQTSCQTQNLCRDAAALGQTFAADPSSCHRYLWCDPDTGITHTQDCRDGMEGFAYFLNDLCVSSSAHCGNLCPPHGQNDIMIAIVGDETCRQYRPCRLPGLTPLSCAAGTRFDRNTGLCISEARVPCIYLIDRPFSCQGRPDGMQHIPGSCSKFAFCFSNELVFQQECEAGYFFDRTLLSCVSGVCPYPPNELINKD